MRSQREAILGAPADAAWNMVVCHGGVPWATGGAQQGFQLLFATRDH